MEERPKQTEPAIHRTDRQERLGYILLPTGAFLLALVALRYSSADYAQILIFALLGLLAILGIFGVFAYFVGILRFVGQAPEEGVTRLIADGASEGHLVVNAKGRIVYANKAYLSLTGQKESPDPRPVERVFTGAPHISQAVYRLSQMAKDGQAASEEIRIAPTLDGSREHGWYKVSVTPQKNGRENYSIWKIAEITHERERQENVFQELQVAINYLDHAPAGFFSLLNDGSIAYMNATLANWLDYDLATVGSPSFSATQIVSSDIAALLTTL